MISPEIIFEDDYLIVGNKAVGLPVQNDKTGDVSLKTIIEDSIDQEVFLINRLDRPASGLVLFAKNRKIASKMNELVQKRLIRKSYLAAVQNKPEKEQAKLTHYLHKKNHKAYISSNINKGKESILAYKLLDKTERYFILEIDLITGRFHQIRAQLAHIACPIKGDVKYGARRANKNRSIHLHARTVSFKHPENGRDINLEAPLPLDPIWNQLTF